MPRIFAISAGMYTKEQIASPNIRLFRLCTKYNKGTEMTLTTRRQLVGHMLVNRDYYDSHLEPATDSDCILWTGPQHRQGYAYCGYRDSATGRHCMTVAHRIAATMKYNRPLARTELVLHQCGNNLCLNPDHLFLGNFSDKAANMVRLGRDRYHRGPRKKND